MNRFDSVGARRLLKRVLHGLGPRAMIVLRMSVYGTLTSILGAFMFGLGFVEHILPSAPTLEDILAQIGLAAMMGGGIGFAYGFAASTFLGLAIALSTLVFFRGMRHPRLFRAVAGATTAVAVYCVSPLDVVRWSLATIMTSDVGRYPESGAVLVLYILAIYLSQIVARKYIREIAISVPKAKIR